MINQDRIHLISAAHTFNVNVDDMIKDILKSESDILEKSLRTNSKPPIKGKITPGKLKWRGIRRCIQNGLEENKIWLEQRGKIISPIIIRSLKLM